MVAKVCHSWVNRFSLWDQWVLKPLKSASSSGAQSIAVVPNGVTRVMSPLLASLRWNSASCSAMCFRHLGVEIACNFVSHVILHNAETKIKLSLPFSL